MKTFLEMLEYRFLVESTTIESLTFPLKIDLSKANIKTNRMGSTKWTYHIERSFTTDYFLFFKCNVSIRTSYK